MSGCPTLAASVARAHSSAQPTRSANRRRGPRSAVAGQAFLNDDFRALAVPGEIRSCKYVAQGFERFEILDRAAGRTEEQVRELVAALCPCPAPRDLVRRLPERKPAQLDLVSAAPALTSPAPAAPRPAPRVEPISEELRVLRMTVGREFAEDLTAVRAALSHQIPDGNLEKVLHACMRLMLRDCERRRRGSGKTRASTAQSAHADGTRYIPAAVRDEIWRRDEGRCTFLGTDGHRCGSTHQLQFHHVVPFGKGGESTVSNLTLLCAAHNRFRAEKDYGAAAVARAITNGRPPVLAPPP